MILRTFFLVLLAAATAFCGMARAQQYRWTDAQGHVHLTDTPPPASAKNVRKIESSAAQPEAAPLPFEIARVQKDFPVTLYTSPGCKDLCEQARATLNKRSVPFTEFQAWNAETLQKMKSAVGSSQVPVLVVGRLAQIGFDQSLFEEKGVLDPEAGRMFRDEILAVGGSRPAAESFRAFRGREPRVDALLRHSGMISA